MPQSQADMCAVPQPATPHKEILELMHSDLHSPVAVHVIGSAKYFAVMIDDKSCRMFLHMLKHKDDYPAHFEELKASVETLMGEKIKHLQMDSSKEYRLIVFEGPRGLHACIEIPRNWSIVCYSFVSTSHHGMYQGCGWYWNQCELLLEDYAKRFRVPKEASALCADELRMLKMAGAEFGIFGTNMKEQLA